MEAHMKLMRICYIGYFYINSLVKLLEVNPAPIYSNHFISLWTLFFTM